MGKSLKDLFEIVEGFDEKQELIAKILLNTSDQDNNPADKPFQELAKKLETDEISMQEALEALDAMTEEDMKEAKAFKITTSGGDEEIKSFEDSQEAKDFARNNRNIKKAEELRENLDEEGRMAKSDLLKLTQYSAKLYKALGDDDQLPAWIQAKITLAADYIGTVKHYLEGEQAMGGEEAPTGQLEESADDIQYYNWEDLHLAIFAKEDMPLEDMSDFVFLPTGVDAKQQLSLLNLKKMMNLPNDYKSKFGTKEDLVKRELGYVERDFYNWKDSFKDIEGDEEVRVICTKSTCTVEVDSITKAADAYTAGKAKGDTSDVYESSLLKILSK